MTEESPAETADEALTDLKFIGPATADAIGEEEFSARDVRDKRVSYRMLVEAGTNPGVASKIRREHSLPWSITGEGSDDLGKRSEQVRGLRDDERDWVSASSGDWETADADTGSSGEAEADGSGDAEVAEAAWRDRSKPTPVTDLDCISESEAEVLGSVGINSVRSLATITPEHVANLLNLDEDEVTRWRDEAADHL